MYSSSHKLAVLERVGFIACSETFDSFVRNVPNEVTKDLLVRLIVLLLYKMLLFDIFIAANV